MPAFRHIKKDALENLYSYLQGEDAKGKAKGLAEHLETRSCAGWRKKEGASVALTRQKLLHLLIAIIRRAVGGEAPCRH
ncbi:hypothetical protein CLV24_101205 [Pontibacter ummariensis]|uniref:Uncharacterized protein n=2 Tax=Pontibacter ummariensis TaxID=1610492 RepID=A0A239B7F6_9BACT|nr:hypothetical protein CLV24_101205 [Pontibacter ummariensis]SNS03800.1 hypothetical protein SAMN06296052_101205 [Pontibacter ummariensis]